MWNKQRKNESGNGDGFLKGLKEINAIENPEQRALAVKTFFDLCKNKWEEEGLLKKLNPEQSAPNKQLAIKQTNRLKRQF